MSLNYLPDLNCFKLHQKILIDNISVEKIFNSKTITNFENFNKNNDNWYVNYYNKETLLVKILFPNEVFNSVNFIDGDSNNLRFKNLKFEKKYNENLDTEKYKIIKKGHPYYITQGKFSGQFRNMFWYVLDKETNEKYYIMDCKGPNKINEYILFSKNSLQKILNIGGSRNVWYIGANGYVATTFKEDDKRKIRYLHQHLMDHYGKGLSKGNNTVDHINTNKLDNRLDNLRLVDQTEQNKNRGKRKRQKSAKCNLPDFIKELPKYVQYVNSKGGYFCIRNHPNYPNEYFQSSTKKEVSIQEKYQSILDKLKEYNNKSLNSKQVSSSNSNTGVKYVSKTIIHKNEAFSFDTKIDGKRYTKKKSKIELKDFQQLVLASFPDIRKYLEKEWNVSLVTSDDNIEMLKKQLPKYFSIYQEKKRNKNEYVWVMSYNNRSNGKRISVKRTLANINPESIKSTINVINLKIKK